MPHDAPAGGAPPPPSEDAVSWRGNHGDVNVDPLYAAVSRASDAARAALAAAAPGLTDRLATLGQTAQAAASRAATAAGRAAASALDGAAAPARFTPPDGAPVRGSFACFWVDDVVAAHGLAGAARRRALRGTLHVTDGAAFFVEAGGAGGLLNAGRPAVSADPIVLPLDRVVGVTRPTPLIVKVDLGGGLAIELTGFGGEEAASDAAALLKRK